MKLKREKKEQEEERNPQGFKTKYYTHWQEMIKQAHKREMTNLKPSTRDFLKKNCPLISEPDEISNNDEALTDARFDTQVKLENQQEWLTEDMWQKKQATMETRKDKKIVPVHNTGYKAENVANFQEKVKQNQEKNRKMNNTLRLVEQTLLRKKEMEEAKKKEIDEI